VTAAAAGQAFEIPGNDALNYGERAEAMQELAEITGEAHAEPMEWAAAANVRLAPRAGLEVVPVWAIRAIYPHCTPAELRIELPVSR